MIALLEKLKTEWHVIRATPWSFLIVCAVAVATIGGGFRYAYREKLADSDRRANQWKSDADYWKDVASHPRAPEKFDNNVAQASQPKPVKKASPKMADSVSAQNSIPAPTINAPGGIPITGGTVSNPTVINNGPPLARLSFTEETVAALLEKGEGEKAIKVHITTDRSIPGAVIGIIFSGPVEMSKGGGPDDPSLKGAAISQMNWGGPLLRNNIPVPNSIGISINAPAAFMPGQELIVPVKSKMDVHVLEVLPVSM
jgi:hypothetical protein